MNVILRSITVLLVSPFPNRRLRACYLQILALLLKRSHVCLNM